MRSVLPADCDKRSIQKSRSSVLKLPKVESAAGDAAYMARVGNADAKNSRNTAAVRK